MYFFFWKKLSRESLKRCWVILQFVWENLYSVTSVSIWETYICHPKIACFSWHTKLLEYIEDIYSFAVNTINIVISIFTSAKHEWKFVCFHYTRWNFLWYSLKKNNFSFYFIIYTPMRVSDVITNITKQNMNVIASTFSAYLALKRWSNQNIPYILTKKMHTNTW